jgi:hypothetical protein
VAVEAIDHIQEETEVLAEVLGKTLEVKAELVFNPALILMLISTRVTTHLTIIRKPLGLVRGAVELERKEMQAVEVMEKTMEETASTSAISSEMNTEKTAGLQVEEQEEKMIMEQTITEEKVGEGMHYTVEAVKTELLIREVAVEEVQMMILHPEMEAQE